MKRIELGRDGERKKLGEESRGLRVFFFYVVISLPPTYNLV